MELAAVGVSTVLFNQVSKITILSLAASMKGPVR